MRSGRFAKILFNLSLSTSDLLLYILRFYFAKSVLVITIHYEYYIKYPFISQHQIFETFLYKTIFIEKTKEIPEFIWRIKVNLVNLFLQIGLIVHARFVNNSFDDERRQPFAVQKKQLSGKDET